jgi:amino acid transporter
MFILINGVQGNALQFGKEVIVAASPKDVTINQNLQKLFAVIIITLVCQLQAYSRAIYIRISNALAVFKVTSLLFIVVCGIVALTNGRVPEAKNEIPTPYGKVDLTNAFASATNNPYQYGIALLNIMRAFLGYENANFVLLYF